MLQAYTSSAAQHVARNYFVTDTQASDWGREVLRAWSAILGKEYIASALTMLPKRLGGCACADMQSRHHAAIWSAWTEAIPHIVLSTRFRDADELLDACPIHLTPL